MMNKKPKSRLYPLAFRLREHERQTLKTLAERWHTKQVEVIRRLLANAIKQECDNGRNS